MKYEWLKNNRDKIPQPSIKCLKDKWQKEKWDNMPLPITKTKNWPELSKTESSFEGLSANRKRASRAEPRTSPPTGGHAKDHYLPPSEGDS